MTGNVVVLVAVGIAALVAGDAGAAQSSRVASAATSYASIADAARKQDWAAVQAIAQLKAHRLKREARILAAMQARPGAPMEEWVALAYDDVPPRMWPVAQRSLLAHVQRIQALQGNP